MGRGDGKGGSRAESGQTRADGNDHCDTRLVTMRVNSTWEVNEIFGCNKADATRSSVDQCGVVCRAASCCEGHVRCAPGDWETACLLK